MNNKPQNQRFSHSLMQAPFSRRNFMVGAGAVGALSIAGLAGCAPKNAAQANEGKAFAEERHDLIVIGSGGAGMSSAIAAHDKGVKDIVILEKMGVLGGNTNFASSGMNASETRFQKEQGINDSNQLFMDETLKGGHHTGNPELVHDLCFNSAAAIDWLDGLGIKLDNLTQTGGMSIKRCHRPTDGSAVGKAVVKTLSHNINERAIPVKTNCKVTEIMRDEKGKFIGVKADNNGVPTIFKAKALVLAAGGLGSNPELVQKYRPDLKGFVTTNQPGATGDGYLMAENCGAELIQMNQIQIHPTVEQTTSTLIAEGVRGAGAILVNKEGNRFFDEMSTRDKVSAAELKQPEGFAWEVFDQEIYDKNKAIAKYDKKGLLKKGANAQTLAAELGINAANLQAAISDYNNAAPGSDKFGRKAGMKKLKHEGTMYAVKVAPGIHHAMGGVKINTSSQALDASGEIIPGFYAAGEVTGGIHGNNRIGGNAVCDIIVNGKNSGEKVAEYLGK